MWGTPGLDYAASVPMYPPCNATFKDDDEITDTPIRNSCTVSWTHIFQLIHV